jgi:hypothetical protein
VDIVLTVNLLLSLCSLSSSHLPPLVGFVSAALFVCYIFLLVYAWSFFGEKIYLTIPFTGTGFYILKPFSTLKWLIITYALITFISFIIWCVGAQLLSLSIFCANTAPSLYNFTLYLVVTYWLGFFIIGCYLIKLKYGNFIEKYVSAHAQGPSVEDMEERIFRKEFKKYDKKKIGTLPQSLLSEFLVKVAVFIPEEELPNVLSEVGVLGDEEIEFNKLLVWFKAYNVKMNGYGDDDDDGGGGDEEEEEESKKKKTGTGGKGIFGRNTKVEPGGNSKTALKQSDSLSRQESLKEKRQKTDGGGGDEDEEE